VVRIAQILRILQGNVSFLQGSSVGLEIPHLKKRILFPSL
jgi:hypothetical protein